MKPAYPRKIKRMLVSHNSKPPGGLPRSGKALGVAVVAVICNFSILSAAERSASLSVPASALVFAGEGLQPPDSEGHFAVGIRLPLAMVKAENCDTPNLIVGMGSINKPNDALSPADHRVIAHDRAVYDQLVALSKQGKTIKLEFRNKTEYLKVRAGIIHAPYCTLSLDEGAAP